MRVEAVGYSEEAASRDAMDAPEALTKLNFTVVVPTYNGAKRIPPVLEKLKHQIIPEGLRWEVIVVDNNSRDETASVVQQFQQTWPSAVPLKYVFEAKQGLAYARQCGIDHASGELVGFLDDDNWPAENWVAEATQFGREHPRAGAYGGRIQGVFEAQPDESVRPLLRFLAIRDYGDRPRQYQVLRLEMPPGAGLTVRKTSWLECVPSTLVNINRSGDDYEISLRLARGGWEIWYVPAMTIGHFIPASRLKREYLLNLTHLYGLCTCKLLMTVTPVWRKPFVLSKSFLGSLKRILTHHYRYAFGHSSLEADCMLAFHVGNLKSPIYYLGSLFSR